LYYNTVSEIYLMLELSEKNASLKFDVYIDRSNSVSIGITTVGVQVGAYQFIDSEKKSAISLANIFDFLKQEKDGVSLYLNIEGLFPTDSEFDPLWRNLLQLPNISAIHIEGKTTALPKIADFFTTALARNYHVTTCSLPSEFPWQQRLRIKLILARNHFFKKNSIRFRSLTFFATKCLLESFVDKFFAKLLDPQIVNELRAENIIFFWQKLFETFAITKMDLIKDHATPLIKNMFYVFLDSTLVKIIDSEKYRLLNTTDEFKQIISSERNSTQNLPLTQRLQRISIIEQALEVNIFQATFSSTLPNAWTVSSTSTKTNAWTTKIDECKKLRLELQELEKEFRHKSVDNRL
jgi:hypothetical protein